MANYNKYSNLNSARRAIAMNVDRSKELSEEADRRISRNSDSENCKKIKTLLDQGYTLKEYSGEDTRCKFILIKDDCEERISIIYGDSVIEIKKILGIN